jgi:Sulfotransferase family
VGRVRRGIARRRGIRVPQDFETRLVWVFGSPRSGSTWLLQLLGDHEAIVPINEPLIGWYLGPFMCDLPAMSAEQLDTSNFTLRRIQKGNRPSFFAEEFADVWMPGLATMMRERFHAHAARYPAARPLSRTWVVIKEPNGSQSADLIMRALPRSRLLFLLRDGRDVVDSELAANSKGSWVGREFPGSAGVDDRVEFVVQSAKKWLWRTEVVEAAYAAHHGPKHMVRYEDLRADPTTHMRRLFDWLEVDIGDSELAAMIEKRAFEALPSEVRGPDQFFRAAKPGGWRDNLNGAEQEALERVIGPKLRELGYDA